MIMAVTKHAESLLPPVGDIKEFHSGQKAQQKTGTIRSAKKNIEIKPYSRSLEKSPLTLLGFLLENTMCSVLVLEYEDSRASCIMCFYFCFSGVF